MTFSFLVATTPLFIALGSYCIDMGKPLGPDTIYEYTYPMEGDGHANATLLLCDECKLPTHPSMYTWKHFSQQRLWRLH